MTVRISTVVFLLRYFQLHRLSSANLRVCKWRASDTATVPTDNRLSSADLPCNATESVG